MTISFGLRRLCLLLATQPCPVAGSVLAGRLSVGGRLPDHTGLLINCSLHAGVQAAAPLWSSSTLMTNLCREYPLIRHLSAAGIPVFCLASSLLFSLSPRASYLRILPECSAPPSAKANNPDVGITSSFKELLFLVFPHHREWGDKPVPSEPLSMRRDSSGEGQLPSSGWGGQAQGLCAQGAGS